MKISKAFSHRDKTKWCMSLFVFQIFGTIEMKAVNLFMFLHKDLWLFVKSWSLYSSYWTQISSFLFFCQSVNIRNLFLPAWTKLWMEQRSAWHINFPSVFPFNLSHSFSLFLSLSTTDCWSVLPLSFSLWHTQTHTHIHNCLSPTLSLLCVL